MSGEADPTAGERDKINAIREGHAEACEGGCDSPWCAEPDARDAHLDELAAIVYGELDHVDADRVQAVLTSDWLAARDAATADRARREGAVEALREAADEVGPALQNEVGGHTSTRSVRNWLSVRAARIARSAS